MRLAVGLMVKGAVKGRMGCALLAFALSNVSCVARPPAPPLPAGVRVLSDLPYREGSSQAWRLDLYLPDAASDGPRPCVVTVHGGGWRAGTKRSHNVLHAVARLTEEGYICASIEYRLIGEAPFPACVEDVQCAVRWLRSAARGFGIDPRRIGGFGNSAGAHVAAMAALVESRDPADERLPHGGHSSLLQAVYGSATPTDLRLLPRDDPRLIPAIFADVAGDEAQLERALRRSSPITHVHAGAPPFLLVDGTADALVTTEQADRFGEAMRAAGAGPIEVLRIDGAGHNVFADNQDRCLPAMVAFFDRHLR